jgi:hypothetical protein
MCFLFPELLFLPIFRSVEAIIMACWAHSGPDNPRQIHGISTYSSNYGWWNFRTWGLLSSSAELSGVVDYQVLDYRNCKVLKFMHRSYTVST